MTRNLKPCPQAHAMKEEMLEALELALECLENNGFGKSYVEDIVKTVLRKARGEHG